MSTFPRNGVLSGMILPAAGLGVGAVIGLALPSVRPAFAGAADGAVADALAGTIAVLILHKVESYLAREWEQCPVYLTLAHDQAEWDLGRALFMAVIPALMAGLTLVALVMRGPPWPLLVLLGWLGQGLHEWHHVAKSLVRRRFYPGVFTAVLFVATMGAWFVPAWADAMGARDRVMPAWWALQPVVLLAFILEDRRWFAAWTAWQASSPG